MTFVKLLSEEEMDLRRPRWTPKLLAEARNPRGIVFGLMSLPCRRALLAQWHLDSLSVEYADECPASMMKNVYPSTPAHDAKASGVEWKTGQAFRRGALWRQNGAVARRLK